MSDKKIENLIKSETKRQNETINLIASENYVSRDVLNALGSVFTNKYAEGYPRARYYGGNEFVDEVEEIAKQRALKLFRVSPEKWGVNVQPYSGSPANLAVLSAIAPVGEKIMGMRLDMGGHLTHGHRASFTGKLWKQISYGVNKNSEIIDYEEIAAIAKKEKPRVIIAGGTAYSRIIDFKKFRRITDEVGSVLIVDMSHFAGLVAGGEYPSPFKYADIVTTTVHKTLRGPRSAFIFSRLKFTDVINKAVFPGLQGGPHINQIAAAAVALFEADSPKFKIYAKQVVKNAKVLADSLKNFGWRIISGGTDTHLFLMDTWQKNIGGGEASEKLEAVNIIVNKNTIPYDERSPFDPSGIRLGTPALTTRGMKEKEMKQIAGLINSALLEKESPKEIRQKVSVLCKSHKIR